MAFPEKEMFGAGAGADAGFMDNHAWYNVLLLLFYSNISESNLCSISCLMSRLRRVHAHTLLLASFPHIIMGVTRLSISTCSRTSSWSMLVHDGS